MMFDESSAIFLGAYGFDHRPEATRRVQVSFGALRKAFGNKLLSELTPADIEHFKRGRAQSVKPVTVRHDLHALSVFLHYARLMGWMENNPLKDIRIPSDRDAIRIHPLSDEEESAYLAEAEKHEFLASFARLLLGTGMRPGEALALRVGDVDRIRHTVFVREGKTPAARRSIRLVGEALYAANQLAGDRRVTDWLFPGRGDSHHTKLNNPHRTACDRAGVRFCIYDFRHTFATRMAERGMPLTTLAAILGHASLRCVTRYVHPAQRTMDEAIERFSI